VAVHVLLGVPGAFSAGNDVAEFAAAAATGKLGLQVIDFLIAVANLEKPLVCGVDGLAIGVGTTVLLHADLVYASDRSLFRTPFLDLGLVPEAASSLLAPRLMGHPLAFELLCLGTGFDASRAASAGMINRVVSADEVEPAAMEAAEALAAKPRQALAAARRLLRTGHVTTREEVLTRIAEEAKEFSRRLASPEAAAAFAAFMGKKK
jgi:enoyl-CoA hydratase/carnithine racemase